MDWKEDISYLDLSDENDIQRSTRAIMQVLIYTIATHIIEVKGRLELRRRSRMSTSLLHY